MSDANVVVMARYVVSYGRARTNVAGRNVRNQTSCRLEAATICPRPLQVDLRPFDLESVVRVACDVGYLCANFSLPRPLRSRLRPDVRDRQTSDVRRASSLNTSALWGRGIMSERRVGDSGGVKPWKSSNGSAPSRTEVGLYERTE